MLNAGAYGNAGNYFNGGSSNVKTGFMLGTNTSGANIGPRGVAAYSVITMGSAPLSTASRRLAPSSAIIGWCGPRPVAFPLTSRWNFDTPLT